MKKAVDINHIINLRTYLDDSINKIISSYTMLFPIDHQQNLYLISILLREGLDEMASH